MKDVLTGCSQVLQIPEPSVAIKDITGEAVEIEMSFCVTEMSAVFLAYTDIFDRAYRAVVVAGGRFASSTTSTADNFNSINPALSSGGDHVLRVHPLFTKLAAHERVTLQASVWRKEYGAGELVVGSGTPIDSLGIVRNGVLLALNEDESLPERIRFTPGQYFGQTEILTGKPVSATISAQTHAVVYYIPRTCLNPLLKKYPHLAEDLCSSLTAMRPPPHSGRCRQSRSGTRR